jgi:hypothetical protein
MKIQCCATFRVAGRTACHLLPLPLVNFSSLRPRDVARYLYQKRSRTPKALTPCTVTHQGAHRKGLPQHFEEACGERLFVEIGKALRIVGCWARSRDFQGKRSTSKEQTARTHRSRSAGIISRQLLYFDPRTVLRLVGKKGVCEGGEDEEEFNHLRPSWSLSESAGPDRTPEHS